MIDAEKELSVASLECFEVPRQEGVGQIKVLGTVAFGGGEARDGVDKDLAEVQALLLHDGQGWVGGGVA